MFVDVDAIKRNLAVNYGADQARDLDDMVCSYSAARDDVEALLRENARLRAFNVVVGQRLEEVSGVRNGRG